jgi:hypothetical protein
MFFLPSAIIFNELLILGSAAEIATSYGLVYQGIEVRASIVSRMFSSRRSDRLWEPPGLVLNA